MKLLKLETSYNHLDFHGHPISLTAAQYTTQFFFQELLYSETSTCIKNWRSKYNLLKLV